MDTKCIFKNVEISTAVKNSIYFSSCCQHFTLFHTKLCFYSFTLDVSFFISTTFIQIDNAFLRFDEVPLKTSTKRSTSSSTSSVQSRVRSLSLDWEIDPQLFEIYLAVPSSEKEQLETDVKYREHVYTISEEDLSDDPPPPAAPTSRTSSSSRTRGRAELRECQSQCVQSSCLPVTDISSFTDCVSDCKAACQQCWFFKTDMNLNSTLHQRFQKMSLFIRNFKSLSRQNIVQFYNI